MDVQEEEIKDKAAKIEYAEQCLTTLKLELKVGFLHSWRNTVEHHVYLVIPIPTGALCLMLILLVQL